MGLYLKSLLLVFLNFSIIHGENLCPASSCGSSMLSIKYPFKLENQTPTKNNCSYINLTCNLSQSKVIVNLPYGGDFYVQNIDYGGRYIQLYDPQDCLMRRLMNFSLASSPLKAIYYEKYTFYVCPLDSKVLGSNRVDTIGCLSNSTNITTATRELSRELMENYGCISIGSWHIPVSRAEQFVGGEFYDNVFLFLTWDVNVCKDCEDQESGKGGEKPMSKIIAIVSSLPALIIISFSCCSLFCLHITKMIKHKYDATSSSPATTESPQITILPQPSTTNTTGLDESKIMACTKLVVLSESDQGNATANNNTCSICLENYGQKDTIRFISNCGHCFHDFCIQLWLGKNNTCPVCRTSLSDVSL